MGKDLPVLRVHQNSFISQDQLPLFLLTFGGNDWDIVPHNILVEMLLNEDDFFMEGHQKDIFVQFIKFAFIKNSHLKHVVNLDYLGLDWCEFRLNQLCLTHLSSLFYCIQTVIVRFLHFQGLSIVLNLKLNDMQHFWHSWWRFRISIQIEFSLQIIVNFLFHFRPKVVKTKTSLHN